MSILSQIQSILGVDAKTSSVVTIHLNGLLINGWTEVVVVRGIEIMPWTAELALTALDPETMSLLDVNPGDLCEVFVGDQLVITGYVVTVSELENPGDHALRVIIASKSTDLVECSAEFSTYQMSTTNALAIANTVAAPSGISVGTINNAGNVDIQLFSVILSETAYQVIERLTRLAGVVFYDQPDGNVVFSGVGSERAASGFVAGKNAEQILRTRSLGSRYSEVIPVLQTTDVLQTSPSSDRHADQMSALSVGPPAVDHGVPRRRTLLILAEQGDTNYAVAKRRAQWEVNRRYGRSQVTNLTCDSWRDVAGNLWRPNTIAPFTDRNGNTTDLLIAEVTFRSSPDGTHADVTLMPVEAFQPEPILLPMSAKEGVQAAAPEGA